jgi:ATP-binding cassette subfamily F protein uup
MPLLNHPRHNNPKRASLASIESQLKEKNEGLNVAGIETGKLNEILQQIVALNSKLDEKGFRWIELTELKEA